MSLSRFHRQARWAPLVVSTIAALSIVCVAPVTDAQSHPGGTLRVNVVGVRSREGHIGCALFSSAEGFPGDTAHALQKVVGRFGRHHTATCVFENVPPGRYAVALGHDENGNGHLDKNLVGIPTEGWGVSNDAPARMGPPSYDEATFRFNGRRELIVVRLRYGL